MTDKGERSLFAGILRLIPFSGVQCRDVCIVTDTAASVKLRFTEELFDVDGVPHRVLLPLADTSTEDPDLNLVSPSITHPITGKPLAPDAILELDGCEALAHFAGRWVPLPYFRFIGRDEQQRPRYDAGPANWVRAWIGTPAASRSNVTLAFDTALARQSRLDAAPYLAPNTEDATFGSTFICVERVDDLGGFVGEQWLADWLADPATKEAAADSKGVEFRHKTTALYLTLLRLLVSSGVLPEARFVDTIQRRFPLRTSSVDLVLDLGHTETTALLVDVTSSHEQTDGYAEQLRVRDLAFPEIVYEGAFPTAAEFTAAPYGDAMLSRDSGRHDAFNWPSLVRIGHEARRLSMRNNGTEGVTGLSNLQSFLMDDVPSPGLWRQSTDNAEDAAQGPMVSGLTLLHVGENGALLGTDVINGGGMLSGRTHPAIRPRFSRASMIGFFTVELVLHAMAQLNSALPTDDGTGEKQLRELQQVVVLAPPAMSAREREALRSRVHAGIVLAWRGLGWEQAVGAPKRPTVTLGLGGDVGAQLAFLHDEVTHKYQGRFRDLLQVYRRGDANGSETLRVASTDFSARATSLTIVDYSLVGDPFGSDTWEPSIKVSERVPVGTDVAAQAMIWSMILPAIERHLEAAGLRPAIHFLEEITGRSMSSLLVEDPYFTRRLNRKVLWAAAHGLCELHANAALSASDGNRCVKLGTLVALGGGRLDGLAEIFDAAALQAGARDFQLAATEIPLKRNSIADLIVRAMNATAEQICGVVATHNCDVLLLGGEGARMPAVQGAMLAQGPVAANRMIDLHTRLNRSSVAVLGAAGAQAPATMLPAIAVALERRNRLAASGLGAKALRLLGATSPAGKLPTNDHNEGGKLVILATSENAIATWPASNGPIHGRIPGKGS
jgi:hypothetical protein